MMRLWTATTRRRSLLGAALLGLAGPLRPARAQPATGAQPARGAVWDDFHVIMWQDKTETQYRALRGLGVDGARVFGFRGPIDAAELQARLAPVLDAGMRFYLENLATDFYSAYHRWTSEHPREVTWLFDQARARLAADPNDPTAFIRTPSLSDPVWLDRIAARMRAHGRAYAPYRPLFYNLGDEPGIADLAAAWDFDRGPESLAAMRVWLRGQYGSLAALNAQWGTEFAGWEAVTPQTTTAALAREDGNYSSWTDFRTWMDEAFARALRIGTDALHAGDPDGLAGIEGTQAPGPGGYDYTRLAHAVDVMEMYGGGDSIDIARSLNPALVVVNTSFGGGPALERHLWHSLLLGSRGTIIWDGSDDYVDAQGVPGARARGMAQVLRTLRGGLGAQFIASTPAPSAVAILYSPTSQHVLWLLGRRGETTPWTARTSETEGNDRNPMRLAIAATVRALTHRGLTPQFISPAMLLDGRLAGPAAPRVLVLPQAIALSPAEAAAIRRFAAAGGHVVADGTPGEYDAHGRRQETPLLAGIAGPVAGLDRLGEVLEQAGVRAGFALHRPDGTPATDVAVRVFRNGGVTLLGVERDPPGAAQPETMDLVLDAPAWINDLRTGQSLGLQSRATLTLDAVTPTLLALSPAALPRPVLAGPAQAVAGRPAHWRLGLSAASPAAAQAVRLRVFDPAGQPAPGYGGTVMLRGQDAVWTVPFAAGDMAGQWRVEATDILGGGVARATVALRAP